MDTLYVVLIGIACIFVGIAVGFIYRKKVCERTIGSAEEKATQIVNDAIKTAEAKQKESILEAKEEIHKHRTEAEKELKDRRNEIQNMEKRLMQREETLDKRAVSYDQKEQNLAKKLAENEKRAAAGRWHQNR